MPITSENVVIIYREGDSESLAFAQAYQNLHSLNNNQLIAVPCSDDEVLVDYATFVEQIETPLSDVIFDPYYGMAVFAIIVGYNVPGGFMDGTDVISTTSRLSRIGHAYSKQIGNPLFNRQVFKRFDATDAQQALIVSRIDAPTLQTALNVLSATQTFIRQGTANGTFFFDKYYIASDFDSDATAYQNDLISFQNTILPVLNMPVHTTTYWDEYTDVDIPQLVNDSFMWSWGHSTAGYRYFEDSRPFRVFLYNADADGAGTVRNADDKRFPMLALSSGYVATAGAMSDPTISGYLRATPFFETLFQGATIGESYMFSCPYLDWTMTLFGDPIVGVLFPRGTSLNNGLNVDGGWDNMMTDLTAALAWSYKRQLDFATIPNILLNYADQTKVDLFSSFVNLANGEASQWNNAYSQAINGVLQFPTGSSTGAPSPLTVYLNERNIQISEIIGEGLNQPTLFPSVYYLPQGYWQIDFVIQGTGVSYTLYNFELQISLESDFSTLIYDLSTSEDITNWLYEENEAQFSAFPILGVPSSYIGRRVRYASPESDYLPRCTVFYCNLIQRDVLNNEIASQTYEMIVSS